MFPKFGNNVISENTILKKAVDTLRERLPPRWDVELLDDGSDGVLRVEAPDGRQVELVASVRRRLEPRGAQVLVDQAQEGTAGRPALAVAPWMSSATRSLLVDAGVNLVDLTGSVRVSLSEPGLYIDTTGADRDPWPEATRATLRGAKAARVVRSLCAAVPPIGVRKLADRAGTTPGYVSKLVRMLDQQAAVGRTKAGQVGEVDLRRLLERWGDEAPLERRASTTSWIAPRGLGALQERMRSTEARYAITGSLAAAQRAPVAPSRVVSIYVEDPQAFAEEAGLRSTETGANVLLLVPDDDYVFEDAWTEQELRFVVLPQVVADLLSGPGRGPAEAQALMDWMNDNSEAWRG